MKTARMRESSQVITSYSPLQYALALQVKDAFKKLSLQYHPDRVPAAKRKSAEEHVRCKAVCTDH